MRFVGIDNAVGKARRFVSGTASVQDEEVKDAAKLAHILRQTLQRLTDLEARVPKEATEFEVATLTGAATISLAHNYNGPVRWWVTCWTRPVSLGAYPTTAPILVQDASSDANTLVLQCSTAGRAVVRVEPANGAMEP
ncbi:hypothetical protein [Acidithiobacillus sp.]|uniref:hypothetical protein n=1 Tax=Acidithiobacillus sp. TaxID=1872118 RepID=UPI00258C7EEB|nr:hypothetical protein [Acidithiobacillus sp.]MDD5374476.1 hypothetical protein [Acidithiobacillus sp.]